MDCMFFSKACFTTNMINGKKLIVMEAKQLPNIGIRDFQHIKVKSFLMHCLYITT